MSRPATRGKKNVATPGKNPNKDGIIVEDITPKEEISKFKEDISSMKRDMCDLRGDISDIRSMLSAHMNEPRKDLSINQGENYRLVNIDTNFNTPMGSRNVFPKVDMRNFDGKDPLTWINQMENFFEVHQIPNGFPISQTRSIHLASVALYSSKEKGSLHLMVNFYRGTPSTI
jgi:hypothetical protein